DQGTIEARGPRYSRLRLIDSKLGSIKNEKDIFESIDTRLTAIADYAGVAAAKLRDQLAEVQAAVDEAKAKYNPLSKASITEVIARGLNRVRSITVGLASLGLSESEIFDTSFLLKQKEADFVDALLKSEGIVVDCLADDEVVTPGQTFNASVSAYANSAAKLIKFELSAPHGWTVVRKDEKTSEADGRSLLQAEYTVTVAPDAEPTRPYWLTSERKGDMFAIERPRQDAMGIEPISAATLAAVVDFNIAGLAVRVRQEAQHRYADRA